MKVFVLDSSALINDLDFSFNAKNAYYMTNANFDELKEFRVKTLAESVLSSRILQVLDPCPQSIDKMLSFLQEIGDRKLSKQDVSLLSLALELKEGGKNPTLVSDDFSVQNVCKHLKISFKGVLQGKVKTAKKWRK